jgi:hypothetical protein
MSIEVYVATQQLNYDTIKGSLHFSRLIETVDHLYRTTIDLVPQCCPRLCFGKMLLMCHKSLLSAATLIARGQPEDVAAISRRAIEIGQLAVAVHLDSQNYVKWLDEKRKMARWDQRLKGELPGNDPGNKWGKDVLSHPLLADLRTCLGVLSDTDAHFTPEFEGNLPWSEEIRPGEGATIMLSYFDTTVPTINLAFVNLAAIHLKLLEIFDTCFNEGLRKDGGWQLLKTMAWQIGRELAVEFSPEESGFSQPS